MDSHLNICRWCDRKVVWATDRAFRFPLDADSAASPEVGVWSLATVGAGLAASKPSAGQAAGMRKSGMQLYVHHALTCLYSAQWYKAKDHGDASRKLGTKR